MTSLSNIEKNILRDILITYRLFISDKHREHPEQKEVITLWSQAFIDENEEWLESMLSKITREAVLNER